MSQLGRFDHRVPDTLGNAISGASVTLYREGATVVSGTGVSPLTVTVRHRGKIAAADTVFVNTTTGTTYSVDSVTATTIVISGFLGTLTLTSGDRIIPSNSQPTLYGDDQGGATTGNPLTTSDTGRANCWMEFGVYDVIVSGGGATTTLFSSQVTPIETQPSGMLNVRAYGAKGDDSTNDTTAIQRAIQEAYDSGYGCVWFPPGVYQATQIVLKTGISLIGSGTNTSPHGAGTQLKQVSGTNTDFLVSDTALSATQFQHNTKISNMYLRGDGVSALGSGIKFSCRTGETLKFSDLVVAYFPVSGIRLTNGVTPLDIDNVQATNNGSYGIDINRSGADLNHYVRLNHISGDDNGTALIRIKTSGGANKGEVYCITGVKAEKITNPKQNNAIILEDLNGSPVFIAGVGATNSSGVAANAVIRIITSSCRLFWACCDRDANYSYVVDDVPNSTTYASSSTAAFGTNSGMTATVSRLAAESGGTLTIATGAVTATNSFHAIDTEGAAATDDLDTINGGTPGYILILRSASDARDPTVKDGTGNIRTAGDFTLSNTQDRMVLMYDSGLGFWMELARSDNA